MVASTFPATVGDGTPRFVLDLAREEARVFDVLVLAPMVPGAVRRERLGEGLRVERFRYFPARWEDLASGAMLDNIAAHRSRIAQVPPFLLSEGLAVAAAINRFEPDVLHLHWTVPQGAVALVAQVLRRRRQRVPWLITSHGADAYAMNRGIPARVKRAVLRRADAVTAVNDQIAERLLSLGANPEATSVVPMGVPLEAVTEVSGGATRVPSRLVFVGRLVEKKGLGVLLDAVRMLPAGDGQPEHDLHVVGDGPLGAGLRQRAAGLRVRFLGELGEREVYRELGEAAIAVVPSVPSSSGDQDGLPVSLLEAMAAGCAPVASELPGLREAISDGESGVLVPAADPAALSAALRRLLEDPALAARLGAGAAARAADFSVRGSGQRYVQILQRLAGRGAEPAGLSHLRRRLPGTRGG